MIKCKYFLNKIEGCTYTSYPYMTIRICGLTLVYHKHCLAEGLDLILIMNNNKDILKDTK